MTLLERHVYPRCATHIPKIAQHNIYGTPYNKTLWPVPLPAVPGLDPVLSIKQDQPSERDLIVSFNVSANGKAVNVEVIQGPEAENSRGPERVIRRLRKMRFRPVFKDGVPAESDTITWAVEASQWGSSQPANVTSSGGSNAT